MTGDGPVTVLLVDDHPLVRQGLQAVLSVVDDIIVVGEASDGRAAVELAAELEPDVVIMDLQLPGLTASMRPGRSWLRSQARPCSC